MEFFDERESEDEMNSFRRGRLLILILLALLVAALAVVNLIPKQEDRAINNDNRGVGAAEFVGGGLDDITEVRSRNTVRGVEIQWVEHRMSTGHICLSELAFDENNQLLDMELSCPD